MAYSGTADSYLKVSHAIRLQHQAFLILHKTNVGEENLEDWYDHFGFDSPLGLQLQVITFVRSLREADLKTFLRNDQKVKTVNRTPSHCHAS